MPKLPTIRVKNPGAPGEFLTINASNFDSSKHERFEEAAVGGSVSPEDLSPSEPPSDPSPAGSSEEPPPPPPPFKKGKRK